MSENEGLPEQIVQLSGIEFRFMLSALASRYWSIKLWCMVVSVVVRCLCNRCCTLSYVCER